MDIKPTYVKVVSNSNIVRFYKTNEHHDAVVKALRRIADEKTMWTGVICTCDGFTVCVYSDETVLKTGDVTIHMHPVHAACAALLKELSQSNLFSETAACEADKLNEFLTEEKANGNDDGMC